MVAPRCLGISDASRRHCASRQNYVCNFSGMACARGFVTFLVLVSMETFCVEPFQAAGVKEFGEAQRRGVGDYFMDPWNVCDLLGLVSGAWGLIARIADVDSPWGRSFYALSAPLLFFRILFFAQILPSQGPMIEVCMSTKCILWSSMTSLLVSPSCGGDCCHYPDRVCFPSILCLCMQCLWRENVKY